MKPATASLSAQSCLLILPRTFYSFGQIISKELTRQGYAVTIENDEHPDNALGKILGKLRLFRPLRWLTLRVFRQRYATQHFDLVLIIKGRGVGRALLAWLRTRCDRLVAYNFDSFLFNPSPLDWYDLVDRYCTFDIRDANEHGIPLVHLFSALPPDAPVERKEYQVSVLMKNHSQRLAYTDAALALLAAPATYVYIYEPNVFSFAWNLLRNPRLYLKYWPSIHFKPLPYRDFLQALSKSELTIDFAHPTQTGITIRCFEALSLGVRILTNNPHVGAHPLFQQGAATHFALGQDAAATRRQLAAAQAGPAIRHLRDSAQFLAELLDQSSAPSRRHASEH